MKNKIKRLSKKVNTAMLSDNYNSYHIIAVATACDVAMGGVVVIVIVFNLVAAHIGCRISKKRRSK